MSKKLLLVLFTSLFLSGCTLFPKTDNAATDVAAPSALPTKAPVLPSASLAPADIKEVTTFEKSQTTSTGTDIDSLEKDINSTIIPDENLTDILTN